MLAPALYSSLRSLLFPDPIILVDHCSKQTRRMSTLEDQPVEAAEPTPQSQGPEAAAPEDSKPSEGDEVKPKVSETEEVAEAEPQEPAPDEGQEPPEVEERSPSSEPKPPPKEKGRLDIEVDMLHEGKVLSLPNSEVGENKNFTLWMY